MESLPIEVLEKVLYLCSGETLSRSSRVSTKWLFAKQNVERLKPFFWRNCCLEEIDASLIDDINPYHQSIDSLSQYKCKQIYIRWFCGKNIGKWTHNCLQFGQSFGSEENAFENISCVDTTGTLAVTGHRSGRLHLIDVFNDVKIEMVSHMNMINDLALINLFGEEKYSFHKSGDYPEDYPSFTNHHHIVSVAGNRAFISLISAKNSSNSFEIVTITERRFLKVRVFRDLLAISSKQSNDISLFRLVLPKKSLTKEALKAVHLTNVSLEQVFQYPNQWSGIFTFANSELSCFCRESNQIASSNVEINLCFLTKDNFKWKWSSIQEVFYEYRHNKNIEHLDQVSVKVTELYGFGDSIFFLVTGLNQTLFTTDCLAFHLCPLEHWLQKYDKITSIALSGTLLVCGTDAGYVLVHHIPTLKRLLYLTHFKPLFIQRISEQRITQISINYDELAPVIAVATISHLFLVNWSPNRVKNNKMFDLIEID